MTEKRSEVSDTPNKPVVEFECLTPLYQIKP